MDSFLAPSSVTITITACGGSQILHARAPSARPSAPSKTRAQDCGFVLHEAAECPLLLLRATGVPRKLVES